MPPTFAGGALCLPPAGGNEAEQTMAHPAPQRQLGDDIVPDPHDDLARADRHGPRDEAEGHLARCGRDERGRGKGRCVDHALIMRD